MDKLVKNADFMQKDETQLLMNQEVFNDSVQDWIQANEDDVTAAQVHSALSVVRTKLCRSDFPSDETPGFEMGLLALSSVDRLVGTVVDKDESKVASFQKAYLDFLLELIQVGPGSSHVNFISVLLENSDISFTEYFQSLRGKELKHVISSLKKEYRPDPGMDWEEYSNHFDKFADTIIGDAFSSEQRQENHREFLDLFLFFNSAAGYKDERAVKAMHNAAYVIDINYDREIFEVIEDVDLLREQFLVVTETILAPEFPESEPIDKETLESLERILKTVDKRLWLKEMYAVILDFALDLTTKKAGQTETRKHFEAIGLFFFNLDDANVEGKTELFEGIVKKFVHTLDNVRDHAYLNIRFVNPIMDDCLAKAMGKSESHVSLWKDMIKALLRCSVPLCIETAYKAMREKDTLLKWKKYPDDIKEIFELLSKVAYPKWLTEDELKTGMEDLVRLSDNFLDEAAKAGIAKLELSGPMLDFAIHCMEMRSLEFSKLALTLLKNIEYNPKKDKALMMQALRQATTMIEDDSYNWGEEDSDEVDELSDAVEKMVETPLDSVKDGKMFTFEEYDELIYLAKKCQTKMMTVPEPAKSIFFSVYRDVSLQTVQLLTAMNEGHRLLPLIPGLIKLTEFDDEQIQGTWSGLLASISYSCGELFAPYIGKLLPFFLENEQEFVLMAIWKSYEFNQAPMEEHFDAMFEYIDTGNSSIKSYIIQLMGLVAKHQPQLFTEEKMERLMKEAQESRDDQMQLLMVVTDVVRKRPELIQPFAAQLMEPDSWQPESSFSVTGLLQLYALSSEEKADEVVGYWMKRLTTSENRNEVQYTLSAFRLVGFKYREVMDKHRDSFEKFKESTTDSDYLLHCTAISDVLDGKSLDKLAEELREVQGDVAELDLRVTGTERDIEEMNETMLEQGEDLDKVKGDVADQGQRLEQTEGQMADTVAKVKEIDGKTLSHAPYWSRDVSRMLNVEADNDWRLLSLRLGFSNDDIRAWATTSDPCMSMLNEWFATHKTREATHAILTSLQLLDREDAAAIVENAMKTAEGVVEDEDFEYAAPPDIFLSYQWGHQEEVKLLRQHLEMAGFTCWMDVGQMGGGDKLFEKIDSGVRGAKMVLSCVTAKYAKSPNCNREVNLAVNLGKPVIPLLMEKMNWPPPGSMGPIFSEYLFIRFFQRVGEETPEGDQRYWPVPKFQELLMQLALIGLKPDLTAVQPEYKDWWVPPVEAVTVDKDRAKKQSSTSAAAPAPQDPNKSPNVFISYQWGKQPQILKLFGRLTSLGYSCWLDIMQMGGGDSLYDKIDRGLRGCKVVLSCVTEKYAKSANCRREVSLADALKRPIVPLLLESDLSWPPPGPMSPVLTGLLYVDCSAPSLQDAWVGPKMEAVLEALRTHVPHVETPGQRGSGDGEEQTRKDKFKVAKEEAPQSVKLAPRAPAAAASPKTKAKPPQNAPAADTQDTKDSRPQNAPAADTQDAKDSRPQNAPAADTQDTKDSRPQKAPKKEPSPAARPKSAADSMNSLGHDDMNTANQFYATSNKLQAKSSCCVVQ